MKINISGPASQWYVDEMELQEGSSVRFFVRYGGHSPIQSGFSLGINLDQPVDPATSIKHEGITYFIEKNDEWYFDNHDLYIDFNDKTAEPAFRYEEITANN